MIKFVHRLTLGAAVLLATAVYDSAHAAPQMLALLQARSPMPLICEAGVCKAEFTSYCLQQKRKMPVADTPYVVAEGRELELILTDAKGNVRTALAAPHIRVKTARRSHTAVEIEIDQQTLAALGAERAAILVGAHVTLAPMPVPGDDNPQTEQEMAIATTVLRSVGANTIDRNVEVAGTAHALNHLINTLPAINRTGSAARARLWNRISSFKPEGVGAKHFDRVAREFSDCWDSRVVEVGAISVHTCVQRRHDWIMWEETDKYWNAIDAGS